MGLLPTDTDMLHILMVMVAVLVTSQNQGDHFTGFQPFE